MKRFQLNFNLPPHTATMPNYLLPTINKHIKLGLKNNKYKVLNMHRDHFQNHLNFRPTAQL